MRIPHCERLKPMGKARVSMTIWSVVVLSIIALFAGCGGGGGSADSPTGTSSPQISTPSSMDLSVAVIGSSSSRQLTISNTGSSNLTIGQISLENNNSLYSIHNDKCSGVTLAPSAECTLEIRLTPGAQIDYTDRLIIPSNDSRNNPIRVNLTGKGRVYGVHINEVDNSISNVMKVLVSVADSAGNPVLPLLPTSAFTIFENGVQQTINSITNPGTTLPISVSLVLDYSGSIPNADRLGMESAARHSISLLDLISGDEASIIKFATNIGLQQNFTSVESILDTAIDAPYPSDTTSTRIYDTIYSTIDYTTASAKNSRRAIILFSDGEDYSTVHTLQDVIDRAIEKDIPIFTIVYLDAQDPKPAIMQEMAEKSGGQYFVAATVADLQSVFDQISDVMGQQYLIEYNTSTTAGTSVSLDVRINHTGNLGGSSKVVTGGM
jgi:VWFA-related protein